MLKLKWMGFLFALLAAFAVGSVGARWMADRNTPPNLPGSELNPTAPIGLGTSGFSTDAIVKNLQAYLRTHSADGIAYGNLGIAYLQKARETGDPTFYVKADDALHQALKIDAQDFRALTGLGVLALARHQFHDALEWGQRAHSLNPYNAGALGIVGDAQIELGLYPEAFDTFQKMVNLRPDLTSYARLSYARELLGDRAGAIEAMRQAVQAGGDNSEGTNWARVQLGNLYFDQADVAEAEQAYQAALNARPNYPYAQAGLANVWAAQGSYTQAISMYAGLVASFPLPQFVIGLGDTYAAAGRVQEAARQYDLVQIEQQLYAANGVDIDAEMALFDADHDRNLPQALERARASFARRPSIAVADILAWTLYRSGDYAAAQDAMNQALRLGTRNALMYYHAGMIAYGSGHSDAAVDYLDKAVALNPRFSLLYADRAKSLLAELRGGKVQIANTESRTLDGGQ